MARVLLFGHRLCFSRFPAVGLLFFLAFLALLGLISTFRSEHPLVSYEDWPRDEEDYAVVVDAGSSGSRVYLYRIVFHLDSPTTLLNIQMLDPSHYRKSIEPGLSSQNPQGVMEYLSPLLQFAAAHIPAHKHKETPLFILATAGMRLLPQQEQEALLGAVRTSLQANCSFLFSPDYVEIISGEQEALYSWVALNYVMGRLDHSSPGSTLAMVELGGASLQVAFEVANHSEARGPTGQVMEINLGCQDHDPLHKHLVSVHTYLGLGANTAFLSYLNLRNSSADGSSSRTVLGEPCLPRGYWEERSLGPNRTTLKLRGTGQLDECRTALQPLVPILVRPPSHLHYYGFSEFWYTMNDLLKMGGPYNYTTFHSAAKEYCSTPWLTLQGKTMRGYSARLRSFPTKVDKLRLKLQCFKSAWMMELLHRGLGFPADGPAPPFTSMDRDVQWTMGALLYRTRYFPLRAMQQRLLGSKAQGSRLYGALSPAVLLVCLAVLCVVASLYLYRLLGDRRKLPRSPSWTAVATHSWA